MKEMIYFFCFACFCLTGCKEIKNDNCRISLSIYAAQNEKIYLYKVPFAGEKRVPADSAIVSNAKDSIIFKVPRDVERLYEIEIASSFRIFEFIADTSYIRITANNITGNYTVTGSNASSSLKAFNDLEKKHKEHLQKIKNSADSLAALPHFNRDLYDAFQKQIANSAAFFRKERIAYADTVSNPVVFMIVFNDADFGNDHAGLKNFILHAAARFNESSRVQQLKQNVLNTLAIFEKEFNVGDSLPSIELPDMNGINFSTASLRGKYYLIDFWSTWCRNCFIYNKYKTEAKKNFAKDKFEIVSVALDDHKQIWQNIITQMNYNWVQLIDEKMWQGAAAQTLAFDSIPFNFLVSPKGRVIAKAIKPDSLLITLHSFIK